MQCSQCGAGVRAEASVCPNCGAPLAHTSQSSGSSFDTFRASQTYVPGGGAPAASQGQSLWQNQGQQGDGAPGERPLGSLQRRLQRSQASMPGGPNSSDNDEHDNGAWDVDPRTRARGDSRASRPRSRPPDDQRRSIGGGRSRSRYDDEYAGDDDDDRHSRAPRGGAGAYDNSRERPRRPDRRGRREEYDASVESRAYQPDDESRAYRAYRDAGPGGPRGDDESAEMSAEGPSYGSARDGYGARRSSYNDPLDDPLDDPRSPFGARQGRRPTQGGRASSGYSRSDAPRESFDPYNPYGPAGYTDEYAADYAERGRTGGYPAPYADDAYPSQEVWSAPDAAYTPASADSRGGKRGKTGAGKSSKSRPPTQRAKRRGGALGVAFTLLLLLVIVAGLGVVYGPKVYHRLLARGGATTPPQSNVTCAAEASPPAQLKPPSGSSAFATTAYTLIYPSTWQKNAQSGTTQGACDVDYVFAQPNSVSSFNVEESGAFVQLSDQQVIQAETQSAQQAGATLTEITSAASTQSIGGEVWQRREYQVTSKTGAKLHLAILAGHHNAAGFAITLVSSDTGFASDDTTIYEPMLHSFQFV